MSHNRNCCVVCVEIARREKKCPVGATCIQFVHRERTCGRAARALNLKAMKPKPVCHDIICVRCSRDSMCNGGGSEEGAGGNRSALFRGITHHGGQEIHRAASLDPTSLPLTLPLARGTLTRRLAATPRFDRKGLESESRGFAFSRRFRSLRRNWCAYTFSFN